jgi:hypothetical protein
MITTKGKSIIAKYLIGQTQSYASYIALGCGPKAIDSNVPFTIEQRAEFTQKTELDMEMFRVPIISKGYIVENDTAEILAANSVYNAGLDKWFTTYNLASVPVYSIGQKISVSGINPIDFDFTDLVIVDVDQEDRFFTVEKQVEEIGYMSGGTASAKVSKVVLTAELPTDEHYEMTEIGIYSAIGNPDLPGKDSRQIFNFAHNDGWALHLGANIEDVPYFVEAIDSQSANNVIDFNDAYPLAFSARSSNSALNKEARILRQERPRFLEDSIFIRGDMSDLSDWASTEQPHIHLQTSFASLATSGPFDDLRLSFSVISRDATNVINPDNVRIMLEFVSGESGVSGVYAKYKVDLSQGTYQVDTQRDFADNRYAVVSKNMSDVETSENFSWSSVDTVRIYVQVEDSLNANSDQFYVALDSFRFENQTVENPLYGLVGYSVLKNTDEKPIVKESNKSGFVEFRYAVDVV